MSGVIEKLTVLVEANTSDLTKGLDKASSSVTAFAGGPITAAVAVIGTGMGC